jgi:phosphoribosylformylglycinamidine synthase
MLLTIPPENVGKIIQVFEKEDVDANVVGSLANERCLTLNYRGETVAKIEMGFLFHPPETVRTAIFEAPELQEPSFQEPENLGEIIIRLLRSPNIASRESIIRTYDHEVKANTVLKPLQGTYAGPNDAAVLKPLENSFKGLVISCGMNPNYGKIDAYWMAASAIDEAIRNNLAVGGRRVALLDNFTWGNPEKPERLGSLVRACEACYDFAKAFKTPFISGKDSLYNESPLGPVTPTLLITAIGIIPDIHSTVSLETKRSGNSVYVIGRTYDELGGSEYYKLNGFIGKNVPKVRTKEAQASFKSLTKAIDSGYVKACHDLSEGGLAVAAAEMVIGGEYGLEIDLKKVPAADLNRDDFVLFAESNSRFLVEVPDRQKKSFENLMKGKASEIGIVTKTRQLMIRGLNGNIVAEANATDLGHSWKETLGSGE